MESEDEEVMFDFGRGSVRISVLVEAIQETLRLAWIPTRTPLFRGVEQTEDGKWKKFPRDNLTYVSPDAHLAAMYGTIYTQGVVDYEALEEQRVYRLENKIRKPLFVFMLTDALYEDRRFDLDDLTPQQVVDYKEGNFKIEDADLRRRVDELYEFLTSDWEDGGYSYSYHRSLDALNAAIARKVGWEETFIFSKEDLAQVLKDIAEEDAFPFPIHGLAACENSGGSFEVALFEGSKVVRAVKYVEQFRRRVNSGWSMTFANGLAPFRMQGNNLVQEWNAKVQRPYNPPNSFLSQVSRRYAIRLFRLHENKYGINWEAIYEHDRMMQWLKPLNAPNFIAEIRNEPGYEW